MKKVGIYPGTFDPIHMGHLALAKEAIKQNKLDKLFFLVEPRPRRKQGVKALEHRNEMVRLALQDEPLMGSIQLNQQRFTATETLPVLVKRFKDAEIIMLMGDDLLAHFAEWSHVEMLIDQLRFSIGVRSSREAEIRQRLDIIQQTTGRRMRVTLFQAPLSRYSSRIIRHEIKKGNKPDGLPSRVRKYIDSERLYSAPAKP